MSSAPRRASASSTTVESIVLALTAEPARISGVVISTAEPHVCAPIDANGNLTSDGTKTYVWNALNQLVEVKAGSTTVATFEYDGAGRRTEKVAAGLTHQYIYDAEDVLEERISGASSDTIRYHHGVGIDEPLARKNSNDVVTYYLADHLGSIVQETNASGAVTLQREYDPGVRPFKVVRHPATPSPAAIGMLRYSCTTIEPDTIRQSTVGFCRTIRQAFPLESTSLSTSAIHLRRESIRLACSGSGRLLKNPCLVGTEPGLSPMVQVR